MSAALLNTGPGTPDSAAPATGHGHDYFVSNASLLIVTTLVVAAGMIGANAFNSILTSAFPGRNTAGPFFQFALFGGAVVSVLLIAYVLTRDLDLRIPRGAFNAA